MRKSYGKVPAYLNKYNKERENAVKQKAYEEEQSKLPPGTRLMGEEERIATLDDLYAAQKATNDQLERLPVVAQSIRMEKHKTELEQKLGRLDKAIDTFSKEKVYVQI